MLFSRTQFSTVPVEILIRVLAFATVPDILSFSLTCKEHHRLVNGSAELTYSISLFYNGCVLVPDRLGTLCFEERLACLRIREKRWGTFDLRQRAARMSIPFKTSGIYDIGNGMLVMNDTGEDDDKIKFLDLREFSEASPSRPRQILSSIDGETPTQEQTSAEDNRVLPLLQQPWHSLTLGRNVVEWQAITAVDESDLVSAIALTHSPLDPIPESGQNSLELRLFHYSSGEPYSNAVCPAFQILSFPFQHGACSVAMDISSNLVLLIVAYSRSTLPPKKCRDELLLVDWRGGIVCQNLTFPKGTYKRLSRISPTIYVFPNIQSASLDLWEIQRKSDAFGNGQEASIILIASLSLPPLLRKWELSSIDCFSSPSPEGLSHSAWDSREQAIVIFNLTFRGVHTQVESSTMLVRRCQLLRVALESDARVEVDRPRTVPWNIWGETATHWNADSETEFLNWITTTAGQRQISRSNTEKRIILKDFNPKLIARKRIAQEKGEELDAGFLSDEPRRHKLIWSRLPSVSSALPYVEYHFDLEDDCQSCGWLMDDERVIHLVDDEQTNQIKYLDIYSMTP